MADPDATNEVDQNAGAEPTELPPPVDPEFDNPDWPQPDWLDDANLRSGERRRVEELAKLAIREFGPLAPADHRVVRAAALGEQADFTTWQYWRDYHAAISAEDGAIKANAKQLPSAFARPVPPARVSAGLIRWLLADAEALEHVHARGVELVGVDLPSQLYLQEARIERQLCVFLSVLRQGVELLGARARTINLNGSLLLPGRMEGGDNGPFRADRVRMTGGLFLRQGFRAEGEVRLLGADIGGNVECDGARLIKHGGTALNAHGATVRGTMFLRKIAELDGEIHLTRSRLGYLTDKPNETGESGIPFWPKRILLTDCRYDAIDPSAPLDARSRLAWLKNHDDTYKSYVGDKEPIDPQPYRQLAEVMRRQGHESDANDVLRVCARRRMLPLFRRRWHRAWYQKPVALLFLGISTLFGLIAGHGYARWRPLAWMLLFWIVGWWMFTHSEGQRMQPSQARALMPWGQAQQAGWLATPEEPGAIQAWLQTPQGIAAQKEHGWDGSDLEWLASYPKFNAVVYSLDAFLPLVSLNQESYWTPMSTYETTRGEKLRSGRWWTREVYLPFHIASGWVIATLFAASFTKLARSD